MKSFPYMFLKISLIILLSFMLVTILSAQTQQSKWIVPPNIVDFTTGFTTSLPGTPPSSYNVANGAFDENGNLLFYVIDDNVYDNLGNVISGTYPGSSYDKEILIVKVPQFCDKYYIIYTKVAPFAPAPFYYIIIDTSTPIPTVQPTVDFTPSGGWIGEFATMAISQLRNDHTRFLYAVGSSAVLKFKIHSGGIDFDQVIYNPMSSVTEFWNREVDLSHDGTQLAWAAYGENGQVNVIQLDNDGNFVSFQDYFIPNTGWGQGAEFSASGDKLFVSTGPSGGINDGINVIDLNAPPTSFQHISGSVNYLSHLEMGYDGNVYATSGTDLANIDPITNLLTPNVYNITSSTNLPDQIDGQNYAKVQVVPDLWMKDSPAEPGIEPNVLDDGPGLGYHSEAIKINLGNKPWDVSSGHNHVIHENPRHGVDNYAYVELSNRGCVPGGAGDEVKLYFSKASTGLLWPLHWINYTQVGLLYGDQIGSIILPNDINPGEQITVKIPWTNVPDPDDFGAFDPNHFCLLARIISSDDPITFPEVPPVATNTVNNNNIVWKNVNVINEFGEIGRVIVRNIRDEVTKAEIHFEFDDFIFENFIAPGKIEINLDPELMLLWQEGGGVVQNMELYEDHFLITNMDNAYLGNIVLQPEQAFNVNILFDTEDTPFVDTPSLFQVVQYSGENMEFDGGVAFELGRAPLCNTISATYSESPEGSCCFDLQLNNQGASGFTSIRLRALDEIGFNNYTIIDERWEFNITEPNELEIVPSSPDTYIQTGNFSPLQFCLNHLEDVPPGIIVEWVAANSESCFDTLFMENLPNCFKPKNEDKFLSNEQSKIRNGENAESNEERLFDQYVKLNPNPTRDRFSIEIEKERSGNGWIQVFDVNGKKVMDDILYPNKMTSISLEDLAPAMYIIIVTIGDQVYIGNVVKQ